MSGIWFTIDRYDHGCTGLAFKNPLAAIQSDAWQVWTDERVRKQFNFGNGTMKDFERYCKNNMCTAVMEGNFWKIAEPLGEEWRRGAERFIEETINKMNW